jgi:hypothetical protein
MVDWKVFVRKRLWHNIKLLHRHSLRGIKKKHETLKHDRSPSRDLNSGPSEYDWGQYSVTVRAVHALILKVWIQLCKILVKHLYLGF